MAFAALRRGRREPRDVGDEVGGIGQRVESEADGRVVTLTGRDDPEDRVDGEALVGELRAAEADGEHPVLGLEPLASQSAAPTAGLTVAPGSAAGMGGAAASTATSAASRATAAWRGRRWEWIIERRTFRWVEGADKRSTPTALPSAPELPIRTPRRLIELMRPSRHSDSPPTRGSMAYGCGSVPDFDRLPPLRCGCAPVARPAPTLPPPRGWPHRAGGGPVGTVSR